MVTPADVRPAVETPGSTSVHTAEPVDYLNHLESPIGVRALNRLHAGVARRNQEKEAELRARFWLLNGPGPE